LVCLFCPYSLIKMSFNLKLLLLCIIAGCLFCDNDIQNLCQRFANDIGARYGTGVKWVDLYARNPDMWQYQWAKLSFNYLNTHLEDEGKQPTTEPGEYFEQWFDNGGSSEQTTVIERDQSSEDSFMVSFTESIGVKMTTEVGFNLFDSFKSSFSLSVSLDLSSTQQVTKKETKSWKISETIKIPSKKSVVFKFFIQEDSYQDFWFNSEVMLEGYVAIWFNNKVDLNHDPQHQSDFHWLWFIPIEEVAKTFASPSYYFKDGKVIYKQRGKIVGKRGIKSYATVEEHDLRPTNNTLKFLE